MIFLASDHAAFPLKEFLKKRLEETGYFISDLGTHSEESVDYPDFAQRLARNVLQEMARGILMCGSGIGVSIAANRFPHIRAALCWNTDLAKLSRMHNNANVLVLPGRFVAPHYGWEIVQTWLNTEFEDGRHQGRIDKIEKFQQNQ